MTIKRRTDAVPFDFREGCVIRELSNGNHYPEVSIAEARVPAGRTTRWHQLSNTWERYIVLSGCGQVETGDNEPAILGIGDVVIIPPGTRQRITALRDEELVFLAICSPPFSPSCYQDLES